jgi:hypothetical protein
MDAKPVKNDKDKLDYLNDKVKTSLSARAGWETQWAKNHALYMGDHKGALEFTGAYYYAMMNLTAQVIDTKSAHLNAVPIRPVVIPRDNNEPVEWYFSQDGMKVAAQNSEQFMQVGLVITPEQLGGAEPMEEETVEALKQMGLADKHFVALSDDLVSEAMTQELESQWVLDAAEQWLSANNSDKLVIGQSDAIVQWNQNESRIHFETLYPYDVFVDPIADSFARANWVAIREIMTKAEAKERWPDFKEEIKNMQVSDDPVNAPHGARYDKLSYADKENRVVHWTMWERNAEIDMSEEEANATGAVATDELGNATVNGEPLAEDGSNWPTKVGVRQLEMLGDVVIFDAESPFGGIPVERNYNIRAVASAFGIGDPMRLADLQDTINRVLSQFAENIAQFRSPMLALPETVFSALESELKRAFSIAGMKLPIPDSMWEATNGNIIKEIAPPQIPQSAVQVFDLLTTNFFRLAGVPSALRGDTQSGTSGRAMEISTSNASEPIAQVARHTEMFLRQLLQTAVYLIVEYMPADEFVKRNKRFEAHVFEAMRRKIRRIGYDVDVQVSGTNRSDQEAQRMISAAQGVQILWQSPTFIEALLKKLGLPDSSTIAQEIKQSQQMQQASIQVQAQVPGPNAPGPRAGMGEAR